MLEISGVKEQDFHAIKATHNRKSVSAWGFIWRKKKDKMGKGRCLLYSTYFETHGKERVLSNVNADLIMPSWI